MYLDSILFLVVNCRSMKGLIDKYAKYSKEIPAEEPKEKQVNEYMVRDSIKNPNYNSSRS